MRLRSFRVVVVCACGILAILIAANSCSLFVDLGELSGGDASVDASPGIDGGPADATTSSTDSGADAASCSGTPVRLQTAHLVANDGGSDDIVDVTLPAASEAGDFIVVGVNFDYGCSGISSVSDTAGNAYHAIVPYDSNGGALALETWGAENIASSPADTVTVKFVGSCEGRNIKVVEYAGIAHENAVDGFATQHGDGGDIPNAEITTTGPAMVFAHTADDTSDEGAADGWTQIFIDDWATLAEERLFSSPTTVTVTARPRADDAWVIQSVALKPCSPN